MYDDFSDPYIYDFDFITSGGFVYREYNESGAQTYPESSNNMEYYTGITPIHQAMLSLVEQRQDCIALFDVTPEYDPNYITEYSRMLNTSYGTMHFPWCYVADPDIANHNILMSPSYVFLYTFLSNLDNNVDAQKWFPPAGVKRATARVVKKPYFEMGSVLLNKWQNDTTARVNPIMRLKQYGYVIYGQYTTLEAIDMYTHSALESLNVRLISNVVKKKIFDVCLNLAFEPNTENLWNKFFAQMDEFLRYMKYNEGVYDYRIVMDESTVTTDDINHLRCPGKVYIAPTRTAEFFDIDFIITEAGAQFNN
jgi:phage tail sheath protein FI